MSAGNVYYCWACDAHCRAVSTVATGACCPRCHEKLSEDCRLAGGPQILSFVLQNDAVHAKEAPPTAPGLWPTRTAAMH